jgi:hypothetical protein
MSDGAVEQGTGRRCQPELPVGPSALLAERRRGAAQRQDAAVPLDRARPAAHVCLAAIEPFLQPSQSRRLPHTSHGQMARTRRKLFNNVAITPTGPADAMAGGRRPYDVGPAAGGLAEHCGESTLGLGHVTIDARTVGGHRRTASGRPGQGPQSIIHRSSLSRSLLSMAGTCTTAYSLGWRPRILWPYEKGVHNTGRNSR